MHSSHSAVQCRPAACRLSWQHDRVRISRSGGQRSELTRVVIDTAAGSVSRARLSTRCCEFSTLNPAVNGRPYRHAYVPASAVDDPVRWGPNQVSGFCGAHVCCCIGPTHMNVKVMRRHPSNRSHC